MKNQLIKNEYQAILFNLIQRELPANYALVDVISDLLGISNDAAYRRIRGDKAINLEETVKLCRHFKISFDALANVIIDENFIRCRYMPLDLHVMDDYLAFLQDMSENIEGFRLAPEQEIIMTTVDVPLFNLFSYKELTLFKMFSWNKTVYGDSDNYDSFFKEKESLENIKKTYDKIIYNYLLIPSSEIWTTNTIDPILRLLRYHSEMNHFEDKKMPLFLCEQLLDLLNTVEKWAEKGKKGPKEIPYHLYVSETDIANTFILFKSLKQSSCLIRLYTVNGLTITDERFCKETEQWLRNSAHRSTLVSGASEKERFKFFASQKQKIRLLIDEIFHSNL